jgi:hypothetical protein
MLDREGADPVPQGYRFGVVWRGFDRGRRAPLTASSAVDERLVRGNALVDSLVRS